LWRSYCSGWEIFRWKQSGRYIVIALAGSSAVQILHGQVIRPLQTLSNMWGHPVKRISLFACAGRREDSLADLILEINALAMRLQHRK